ncbi:MAG: hypothetical protein EF812_03420 [Methanosarcinales archaeon]|nr:MAG: hypothetical protein EF812_03420 [Methanosarcinales archaeon]
MFAEFDSSGVDEVYADDVHVYRVNRPRISWNETLLKSILEPKNLWEAVFKVENKKVRDFIENGLISESELAEAKYTYAKQVLLIEHADASHSTPTRCYLQASGIYAFFRLQREKSRQGIATF